MLTAFLVVGGFCLILGGVYPLVAILLFPIYSLATGDKDFFQYLREL